MIISTFRARSLSAFLLSGALCRRIMGTPPEASVETMLRNKPLPITELMNEDLVAIAGVALEYDFPEINTDSLINQPPALSHRVRYWISKFEATTCFSIWIKSAL